MVVDVPMKSPFKAEVPKEEYLMVILSLIIVAGGAWMMGGFYSFGSYWMGVGGWFVGGLALGLLIRDERLRIHNPALKPVWLLWIVFLVWLVISFANPSYRPVDLPEGKSFVTSNPIDWLPSVVSRLDSGPAMFQLSGSLVLAWSIIAIIRTQRAARALLLGMVINAFILSLLGAWFTVVSEPNILGVFKAVNSSFFASFTYHNHWVAYSIFHLFLATGLMSYYNHLNKKWGGVSHLLVFLGVVCFFLWLSLLLVESRLGLLMAGGYVCFLLLYLVRRKIRILWKNPIRSLFVVIGVVACAWMLFHIVAPQLLPTTQRISDAVEVVAHEGSDVDSFRFDHSPKNAAELIQDKPLLGWGWGSYRIALRLYSPQYMGDRFATFAHNDWLQFVTELGVLGCLLLLFPLVHMSINLTSQDTIARFSRMAIVLLLCIALVEGPFTNPIVLLSVLLAMFCDLGMRGNMEKEYKSEHKGV